MAQERKKFARSRELEPVEFEVDGEVFRAVSVAPAMAVLDVAAVNDAEGLGRVHLIMQFLDQVLEPDSAERFSARLRSSENPVSVEEVAEIAVWLFEEVYAPERPTQAVSASPNGSATTGPSSTDTAPAGDTTPEPKAQRVL